MRLIRPEHESVCSVPWCQEPYYSITFCSRHYRRYRRHGSALTDGEQAAFDYGVSLATTQKEQVDG